MQPLHPSLHRCLASSLISFFCLSWFCHLQLFRISFYVFGPYLLWVCFFCFVTLSQLTPILSPPPSVPSASHLPCEVCVSLSAAANLPSTCCVLLFDCETKHSYSKSSIARVPHTHTCICAHMHTYTHARTHTCICACTHTYMHTHICTRTHTQTYMHTYMHTCMHMYTCTYMHTHTHMHTYMHTMDQ